MFGFFLVIILIASAIAVGFAYSIGRMAGNEMSSDRKRELNSLRELRTTLFRMASEQAAVGDPFAMQVTNEINDQIRSIES